MHRRFSVPQKIIQSCNFSDPMSRWDETAFDPNYENLPLSEFRPMLKKILQRYIMVIHIQAETTLKWQNLLSSNDIFLSIF